MSGEEGEKKDLKKTILTERGKGESVPHIFLD